MNPGDIIEDQNIGRGMIVYFDVEHYPLCAFPENPDLVLCDEETLKYIANINDLSDPPPKGGRWKLYRRFVIDMVTQISIETCRFRNRG